MGHPGAKPILGAAEDFSGKAGRQKREEERSYLAGAEKKQTGFLIQIKAADLIDPRTVPLEADRT